MPNRNMQVKFQRAGVQRAEYATQTQFRSDYHDGLRAEMLPLDAAAQMVADHIAKTRAQTEQRKAVREAMGKRTVFPWTRR
jgi:hypothetical protein